MSITTLRDLAGTGRGLGNLTVEEIQALLDEHATASVKPTKGERREAKAAAQPRRTPAEDAERAEKRAAYKANKALNAELAPWFRSNGLVPSGQAWAAAKAGSRDIAALQALNIADGLKPLAAKGGAAKAEQAKTKAPVRTPRAQARTEAKAAKAVETADAERQAKIAALIAADFTPEQAEAIARLG